MLMVVAILIALGPWMGQVMVDFTIELLNEQMQEGGQPRNVVSSCQVIERDTVRPARVFPKNEGGRK